MIPPYQANGDLPPGVHLATWPEVVDRYGFNLHRQRLLAGLRPGLEALRFARCRFAYLDGSFVTSKDQPEDFDVCWDEAGVIPGLLDPILRTTDLGRLAQRLKYRGEFLPANLIDTGSDLKIFQLFQSNPTNGRPKGIVVLDLGGMT